MLRSVVYQLATSDNRDWFLTDFADKGTVMVWSASTGRKVAEYDTILDFGGRRLAIAHSKDAFAVGAYTRRGVACYRLGNGEKLWHRKDLKGVQEIRILPDDKILFCGFDSKPGHLLDLDNGNTLETPRGVREAFFDPYPSPLSYRKDNVEVLRSSRWEQIVIERSTALVMDVAFSHDYVAVAGGAESLHKREGIVRFIRRQDPDKTIVYRSPSGEHVTRLAYSPKSEAFFGFQLNFMKRAPSSLLRFDLPADKPTFVASVGTPFAEAFCDGGNHLITSDGLYVNTATGDVDKQFEFPQWEPPGSTS